MVDLPGGGLNPANPFPFLRNIFGTQPPPAAPVTTPPLPPGRSEPLQIIPPQFQTEVKPAEAPPAPPQGQAQESILFVGLNPDSRHEVRALRSSGAEVKVLKTQNNSYNGHNLETDEGVSGFVQSLRLTPSQADSLTTLLQDADPLGRDELAGMAQLFARGEKGGTIPPRMVLSGHSDGVSLWSDHDNSSISFDEIGSLAKIFPKAAAKIEDIHVSACNGGYKSNLSVFREGFPNLKTFWSYTNTAPAGSNGAPQHLKAWEKATRGDVTSLDRKEQVQALHGTARRTNLSVWSQQGDFQSRSSKRMSQEEAEQIVDRHRHGNGSRSEGANGALKQAYDALQDLRGSQTQEFERNYFDGVIGSALLLRFDEQVAKNLDRAFSAEIRTAFQNLGVTPPDFSSQNRKQLLHSVHAFERAYEARQGQLSESQQTQIDSIRTILSAYQSADAQLFSSQWTDPLSRDAIEKMREEFLP